MDEIPLFCTICNSPYYKCFNCGYVYCECEGNKDNCPECDSTDIGYADIEDVEFTIFEDIERNFEDIESEDDYFI
ncbi:MAG: hypothetical protein NZ891_05050 [bacterium]|nr:hypothetical protein [bacterium]MDW8164091.1 hypothetical protein [Candidatus Omnitrophota bacterium]